jgi:hypothetical protein
VRLFLIIAMVTFYLSACPRPLEKEAPSTSSHSDKTNPQKFPQLELEASKGPPQLPEHLKAAMAQKRAINQKQPVDKIRHEDRVRQRSKQADMLLLTAERERAQGNWQAAQRMCTEARSYGAGIPSIGYRPHLCVSEGFVERGMWDQVLYRFENKTQLKEKWAGYAHWQLLGARALVQKGNALKAAVVLEKIKKHPEVASEVQRLLREMSSK